MPPNPSGPEGVRCQASVEVRRADHAGADEAPECRCGRCEADGPHGDVVDGHPGGQSNHLPAVDSASLMVRPCAGPLISRMWTVHQPPSRVTSISKRLPDAPRWASSSWNPARRPSRTSNGRWDGFEAVE